MTAEKSRKNLLIGIETGSEDMEFHSANGTILAKGYTRVVIGERGPYVEFKKSHIKWENFCIPPDQKFRLTNSDVFYDEYRSTDASWVKLYLQKRKVSYADYRIGRCYIAPSDLLRDEMQPVILSP